MTETLTPAQKGARTRAENKAKALAAEAAAAKPTLDAENDVFDIPVVTEEVPVQAKTALAADAVTVQLPPVVQTVVDAIDTVGSDENFQVTASRVTSKFSAKARNIIYTIGIVLGSVATAAFPVVAYLTGNTQLITGSILAISLAASNLLAKLNLSKTAADINKEVAAAAKAG